MNRNQRNRDLHDPDSMSESISDMCLLTFVNCPEKPARTFFVVAIT